MASMAQQDQEIYHKIELDLAEAFLETDAAIKEGTEELKISTKSSKAEKKINALKAKLGKLNENIDKEYKIV